MLAFYQNLLFREHFSIPSDMNQLQCFTFSRKVRKNWFQSRVKSPWPLPNLIRYLNFHMWTACLTELFRFFFLSSQPCVLFSSVSFPLLSAPLMRRWVPKGRDWWNFRCLLNLCPLFWLLLEVGRSVTCGIFETWPSCLHMSEVPVPMFCAAWTLQRQEIGTYLTLERVPWFQCGCAFPEPKLGYS